MFIDLQPQTHYHTQKLLNDLKKCLPQETIASIERISFVTDYSSSENTTKIKQRIRRITPMLSNPHDKQLLIDLMRLYNKLYDDETSKNTRLLIDESFFSLINLYTHPKNADYALKQAALNLMQESIKEKPDFEIMIQSFQTINAVQINDESHQQISNTLNDIAELAANFILLVLILNALAVLAAVCGIMAYGTIPIAAIVVPIVAAGIIYATANIIKIVRDLFIDKDIHEGLHTLNLKGPGFFTKSIKDNEPSLIQVPQKESAPTL